MFGSSEAACWNCFSRARASAILDLGCGTGQLTAEIAASGAQVVGLDSSPEMLGQARQNYPHLKFVLADATDFRFEEPFDAVSRTPRCIGLRCGSFGEVHRRCASARRPIRRRIRGARAISRKSWRHFAPSLARQPKSSARGGSGESANTQLCWKGTASKFSKPAFSTGPRRWKGERGMEDWIEMFCGSYLRDLTLMRAKEKIQRTGGASCVRSFITRASGRWTIGACG